MKKFVDYYRVLGLKPTSSQPEIRSAYVGLAKKHHPDKGGSPARMHLINDAYETLRDPLRKSEFDRRRQVLLNRKTVSEISEQPMTRERVPVKPARSRTKRSLLIVLIVAVIISIGALIISWQKNDESSTDTVTGEQQKLDELTNLKKQHDECVAAFDQINIELNQINQSLSSASARGDSEAYNKIVPNQNAVVGAYNAKRAECASLKTKYNEAASAYNATINNEP